MRWEYNVGQKIKDPRIVEMLDFGWDHGQPYLALEWFPSQNLKHHILQGVAKLAPLVPTIITQSGEALDHFNSRGWVHRDVKPDNFLLSDGGEVKLIDFALAYPCRRGLLKFLTPRAKVQGTRSYMSPEQIRGGVIDQRADLYGFACMIAELVSGKPLFTGTSSNDLLMKHLRSTPPPLEALNPNVTPEFSKLIRRCLAKKPDGRPGTVADFLAEFRTMRVFKMTSGGNS